MLRALVSPNAEPGGQFGHSVAGAGDIDSDGCPDIVVGAPEEDYSMTDAGRAYVFSGADGSVLLRLLSSYPGYGRFGYSVSGAGDVDDDGHDDVTIGAPQEPWGVLA